MTLLREVTTPDVTTPDGGRLDVRVDPRSGTVTEVTPAGLAVRGHGEEAHDLAGYLLLPAPAEPHAHLDKALLADRAPNPAGDLLGAIEAMLVVAPSLTHADLVDRATRAALIGLAAGTTAVRTHADVGEATGIRHVEALVEVRESLRHLMTIQVVALTSPPTCGPDGALNASLLRAALAAGADVAGGCPHLDPDPLGCMRACFDAAEAAGVPLDLHTDETLDPGAHGLADLAREVMSRGFRHGVTAGHCVSLGTQPDGTCGEVARLVADAGVAVVALPQTNLYLQGRDHPVSTPRGLTAVKALLAAGATVAAGGDNMRDPFNAMGSGDALEVAALLVVTGHVTPEQAYTAVSAGSRAAMGLPAVSVAVGSPAELVAVRAGSLAEALATRTADRLVVSRGRAVSRTTVESTFLVGPVPASLTSTFHGSGTNP